MLSPLQDGTDKHLGKTNATDKRHISPSSEEEEEMGANQEESFYKLLYLLDMASRREPGMLISPVLRFLSPDFSCFYPSKSHLLHRHLPRFTRIQTRHYRLHCLSDSLDCNEFSHKLELAHYIHQVDAIKGLNIKLRNCSHSLLYNKKTTIHYQISRLAQCIKFMFICPLRGHVIIARSYFIVKAFNKL